MSVIFKVVLLCLLAVLLVIVLGKVIIWICRKISLLFAKNQLVSTLRSKKQERNTKLQQELSNLPMISLSPGVTEEDIISSDVTNLKRMLDENKVSSEQILIIYMRRALTIGLQHDLITSSNFEEALSLARACDLKRRDKYKSKPIPNDQEGFLFGIPVSIKDLFEMKGFEANYGCGALCNRPQAHDGYIIRVLRAQGAIPFIRSNIPQVGFALECWNQAYGRGLNPWDKSRTPGGSSGGEAGLIAARCSPIGLGSDMGGSIRAPSAFCGVYGFKPSSTRVPSKGAVVMTKAFEGLTNIVPVSFGPLAKSSDDVALMMKCLLAAEFHEKNKNLDEGDPYYVISPWNQRVFEEKKPRRIAFVRNTNHMPVCTTAIRAMDEAVTSLKSYGNELVDVAEIEDINEFLKEAQSLFYQTVTADRDLGAFKDAIQQQGLDDEIFKNLKALLNLPNCVKSLAIGLSKCLNWPRVQGMILSIRPKNTHELLEHIYKVREFREKFVKWWNKHGLDAILLPNIGMPAFKHGFSQDISVFGAYTMLVNLLDFPAGAVPITRIQENETIYDEKLPCNRDMFSKKAQENLNESQGMPIGIQVMTMFRQEEICVALMKQIEEKVRFYKNNDFPA